MGRVPGPVKWLVAPALAALLGYGVVGPRLAGRQKALVKEVQDRVGEISPTLAPKIAPASGAVETPPDAPTDDDPAKPAPAPAVSVGVKPVDGNAPDDAPRPRRRHRRHHTTDDEAPPQTDANPDRTEMDPASGP